MLCRLSLGKLNKGTAILFDYVDGGNLPKLVKILLKIILFDFGRDTADLKQIWNFSLEWKTYPESGDCFIIWRFDWGKWFGAFEQFIGHWIFSTVETVDNVLLRKWIIGIGRLLVPVRTLFTTATFALIKILEGFLSSWKLTLTQNEQICGKFLL